MLGEVGRSVGSLLGVEITADCVRMLQLSRRRGRCQVTGWALEPFQAMQVDGHAFGEPLRAALRRAHERCATRQRKVALALPASQVICKVCQVTADACGQDMEAQLLALADQLFPFPLDDLAMDFQVLGPSARSPGVVDVLVAACRQSQLEPFEQLFAQVGLELVALEVDSIVLWRVLAPGASLVLQMEEAHVVAHRWPTDGVPERQQVALFSPGQWIEALQGLGLDGEVLLTGGAANAERVSAIVERLGVHCRLACPPALSGLKDAGASLVLAYGLAQGGGA
ncbi:type IV pilus biogenesis protein PilM [Pseudomonas xantholysinigenes]|uniref:Pilus assembly protein PilM n=1 Tax=Pseudomonas xantholysinigenes TaxID=2745490 RepID=A0A9E6PWU3_9PSED|nr:pilus assembly protein PilM [Pseudomonas xantholysinigenes]QXI38208.1 pilus assembly protein PilM [Pseudomonas xantholysinigenes]